MNRHVNRSPFDECKSNGQQYLKRLRDYVENNNLTLPLLSCGYLCITTPMFQYAYTLQLHNHNNISNVAPKERKTTKNINTMYAL